jgi:hypothetical protein
VGEVPTDAAAVAESAAALAQAWVQMLGLATGVPPAASAPATPSSPVALPPVPPGETARMSLWLHNAGPDGLATAATSLVGPAGASLPAEAVEVQRAPGEPPPGAATELHVRVTVPCGQPAGCYRGLVVSPPHASLAISVEVLPA